MSHTQVRGADFKLEIVVISVSDFDRAKRFYSNLGWRLDAELAKGDEYRAIQFTPPGSGCSIIFGNNVTAAAPGSAQGLYLIVSNIEAARNELLGRGVKVSEVFHDAGDVHTGPDEPYLFGRVRVNGPIPNIALIARSLPSATRSATAGCCRKLLRVYRDGRCRGHNIHLANRARERAPACGGRARRA